MSTSGHAAMEIAADFCSSEPVESQSNPEIAIYAQSGKSLSKLPCHNHQDILHLPVPSKILFDSYGALSSLLGHNIKLCSRILQYVAIRLFRTHTRDTSAHNPQIFKLLRQGLASRIRRPRQTNSINPALKNWCSPRALSPLLRVLHGE